ncbi:MAG: thiol-disulfide oxidoreductase DCC family protein [Saprospiraceae bacterium]
MTNEVQTIPKKGPVLLFDGACNLCNASVQWVIRRDPEGIFRFASLQSEPGQRLLRKYGLPERGFDTVVLVEGGVARTHSDVPLRIFEILGGRWAWLSMLKWVPRPVRDALYAWVAHRRYRWFGKRDACMVPASAQKVRFL